MYTMVIRKKEEEEEEEGKVLRLLYRDWEI